MVLARKNLLILLFRGKRNLQLNLCCLWNGNGICWRAIFQLALKDCLFEKRTIAFPMDWPRKHPFIWIINKVAISFPWFEGAFRRFRLLILWSSHFFCLGMPPPSHVVLKIGLWILQSWWSSIYFALALQKKINMLICSQGFWIERSNLAPSSHPKYEESIKTKGNFGCPTSNFQDEWFLPPSQIIPQKAKR